MIASEWSDGVSLDKIGVILVDHGSRREESNRLLLEVVDSFRRQAHWKIVEPAHMELAEPSIASAYRSCVEQGAEVVVVFPYFLSPGRHWNQDIPALTAAAAKAHPGVRHLVTAPLGLHPFMLQVIDERISHCLQHAVADGPTCDICEETESCTMQPAPASNRE
ncbi:MAG: hypothetical protein MI725_17110 [Pirellulales bacterium]|nr:hypothetical protein [Pirellulales bacterium]